MIKISNQRRKRKLSNLYQLTNNYETVLNMIYDEDVDEQMILDTLEGIEGEIEDKADGYAKIIKELETRRDARKAESKGFLIVQKYLTIE